MRLELAERLRCPRPHAPTPLVVVAQEVRDRELLSGVAGCPLCGLEVRVLGGELLFGPTADGGGRTAVAMQDATDAGGDAGLDRIQALLGLAEPEGAVLLGGSYVAFAQALVVRCEVSVLALGDWSAIPFTDGTFRGAALDGASAEGLIGEAARCVAIGGRVVAPIGIPVPPGVRELARDEREWVGEREATSIVVELKRRR